MKYTIEISDTQQRIIDAFKSILEYAYVDYSFSQNEDRTGVSNALAKMEYSYSSDTHIEFYLEKNEIWLRSYFYEKSIKICDEFRAKESALVAVAKALDPNVKIVIKKCNFQEDPIVERL